MRRNRHLFKFRYAIGWLLLGLYGCATIPGPMTGVPRQPLAPDLAGYYDYSPQSLSARIETTEERSGYLLQRLTLTPAQNPGLHPIRVDWYKPEGSGAASSSGSHKPKGSDPFRGQTPMGTGPLPVVLISPILAGNDLYINEFARFFAARGLQAVIVYREKELFSAGRPLADVEAHLKESVIQLRQALDWLQEQPEVDPERIGTFAISLGAMLTVVLAAVDPRVQASVFGLPAGDIPQILMTSKDKAIRKRRINYMRENNLSEEEALKQLEAVIVSEPMEFAPAVGSDRALLMAGLFDRVVGFGRSMKLWKRMGRPRLILLPTGHYTAALATPWLKIVTYSFLRRKLRHAQ